MAFIELKNRSQNRLYFHWLSDLSMETPDLPLCQSTAVSPRRGSKVWLQRFHEIYYISQNSWNICAFSHKYIEFTKNVCTAMELDDPKELSGLLRPLDAFINFIYYLLSA